MEWKTFNRTVKVFNEDGTSHRREELVKVFCKQEWLSECEYSIVPTSLGFRGVFKFKNSEEYILGCQDNLDIVKEYCEKHLNSIRSKIS